MWYLGVSYTEAKKPLVFSSVILPALTLIAVSGAHIGTKETIFAFGLSTVIGVIFGKILVEWGVVSYNASMTNEQSPELMDIIERLKRIEEKIKSL
jgi:hypothetical protein